MSLMLNFLPTLKALSSALREKAKSLSAKKRLLILAAIINFSLISLLLNSVRPFDSTRTFLVSPAGPLKPLSGSKNAHEVFGFAPYWTFDKLDNIDFDTLTTLAYFGVPVQGSGDLDREDYGYQIFKSRKATQLFQKSHHSSTRVVLTFTQMQNWPILALLDDPKAQANFINQATEEVQKRGIDGINVDFEYNGDPGPEYRNKFSQLVASLTARMRQINPESKVTVSVYAASVKEPKIYDIAALSKVSDGIFMMAYDFSRLYADQAAPTAPLHGYKDGEYWYDVSTAVEDFLTQMPSDKLILGVPWYGYNYLVYEPEVKAETRPSYSWRGQPAVQTYEAVAEHVRPDRTDISDFKSGWDEAGQVGWKAYYNDNTGTWRMIFSEDVRSLSLKYDFAKNMKLGGVGVWALGFDGGRNELWSLLKEKFGFKLPDHSLIGRMITAEEDYEY